MNISEIKLRISECEKDLITSKKIIAGISTSLEKFERALDLNNAAIKKLLAGLIDNDSIVLTESDREKAYELDKVEFENRYVNYDGTWKELSIKTIEGGISANLFDIILNSTSELNKILSNQKRELAKQIEEQKLIVTKLAEYKEARDKILYESQSVEPSQEEPPTTTHKPEGGELTRRVLELAEELGMNKRSADFAIKSKTIFNKIQKEGIDTTLESVRKTLNRNDHYSNKRKLK